MDHVLGFIFDMIFFNDHLNITNLDYWLGERDEYWPECQPLILHFFLRRRYVDR